MVLSAVKAWEWLAADEALRGVLFATKKYIEGLSADGISPQEIEARLNEHYEVIRKEVDYVAKKYGRQYGMLGGTRMSLYRLGEIALNGYTSLLRIAEERKNGRMVMC